VRSALTAHATVLAGTAMVLGISVVQTLLDHGDNPRFLVPLQMTVILVVSVIVHELLKARATHPG